MFRVSTPLPCLETILAHSHGLCRRLSDLYTTTCLHKATRSSKEDQANVSTSGEITPLNVSTVDYAVWRHDVQSAQRALMVANRTHSYPHERSHHLFGTRTRGHEVHMAMIRACIFHLFHILCSVSGIPIVSSSPLRICLVGWTVFRTLPE